MCTRFPAFVVRIYYVCCPVSEVKYKPQSLVVVFLSALPAHLLWHDRNIWQYIANKTTSFYVRIYCLIYCYKFVVGGLHAITIKSLYPLQSVTIECADMTGLEQINALAELATPLQSLTITPWGNPITRHTLFRPYTLYRLHHLSLSKLNNETVTDEELVCAEQLFGRLGQLTTTKLAQARLLALVSKYRSVMITLLCNVHVGYVAVVKLYYFRQ